MRSYIAALRLSCALCALTLTAPIVASQETSTKGSAQVHLVITNEAVRDGDVPALQPGDVKVKQGKTSLKVNQLIPAKGENAALQLFVLIDDTLSSTVGNNLNDIRDFINAQPAATVIAIGYMSNAAVNVAQNFTADHELAVKALRLPRGSLSTMDSPYLSLISLVKGWQQQNVRREVLMVSDGIDRLRGEQPVASRVGPNSGTRNSRLGPDYGPVYHSMPTMNPDVNSASEISQRYNVLVYSIYAVGIGRAARSSWDLQIGLSGLTKLADETGGDCFSLGTSTSVSFKPYLERLQKNFDNQYYVVFQATPKGKGGLQRVNVTTEVPNSEIAAPDNIWVAPGK
jgi:hypothetical protein